ncbi:SMI1/KNR4 family protein [Cronobacter turicensis]|uniref:SMI1/KNR4 family protein n=1 Tax=Cronobacter turicensis TaxID=413502 RepID=UPI001D1C9796|nr:SMI1/KNR4 family protein [Cronobacter turicensis]EGT4494259.1 SMI1/KNR4 family protein [Cronobacter turicensis]EKM0439323.1 SMI1/KNR4 family protein [Cronobacter turicensis]ELY4323839.1 SMI1/KNR4 family protein [Cronobacter turicensis]ELY5943996.1 SMI1/KNR4 family protein [Cronobacter turicensis]ELY5965361.1 SMI1/KNR4 family protein [Cronobacter turicensis]
MKDIYDELDKLISESGEEVRGSGPATQDMIRVYEKELKVQFPYTYKVFLEKYGTLSFNGESFYGISKLGLGAQSAPDVGYTTLKARELGDIDNTMILIKSSGYGPLFAIDVSVQKHGEAVVVETDLSFKREGSKKIVAKSFAEFLIHEIEDSLDDL